MNNNDDKRTAWIVVGPYVWGKGFTREQAMRAAKDSNGGRALGRTVIYRVEPRTYVNDMGNLIWFPGGLAERFEKALTDILALDGLGDSMARVEAIASEALRHRPNATDPNRPLMVERLVNGKPVALDLKEEK